MSKKEALELVRKIFEQSAWAEEDYRPIMEALK